MTAMRYRTSDNHDAEANIALSLIADQVLNKQGGVVLTVFVVPDPAVDDYLVRHVVCTRRSRLPLDSKTVIEAAAKECRRALRHLAFELAKEVPLG